MSELLSICWVHGKADFWNAMRTHSDLLTTSSPSEGKVRSIGGKCSRWRMRASCVITFALVSMVCSVRQISELVSMKLLHVVKLKFDTSSPDLAKFVQAQQKTKYGFFTKTCFFSKQLVFLTGSYWAYICFWSLKLLVCIYIYIHRKILLYTRYIHAHILNIHMSYIYIYIYVYDICILSIYVCILYIYTYIYIYIHVQDIVKMCMPVLNLLNHCRTEGSGQGRSGRKADSVRSLAKWSILLEP